MFFKSMQYLCSAILLSMDHFKSALLSLVDYNHSHDLLLYSLVSIFLEHTDIGGINFPESKYFTIPLPKCVGKSEN